MPAPADGPGGAKTGWSRQYDRLRGLLQDVVDFFVVHEAPPVEEAPPARSPPSPNPLSRVLSFS
jgi:hypothetical protein